MTHSQKPQEVYFFGTCLVDLFYPEAGISAMQLIEREGVRIIFPQAQTCCGQPAFNSGYRQEAQNVALEQIKWFPKKIPIVVPSGSCGAMMRDHYLALFQDHWAFEAVQSFSERITEFSQFLVHVLKIELEDLGKPIDLTYHSSCHALREMKVEDEPKQLLAQLKNVNLIELERERECCGFGGTFSIKFSEISQAMLADKIADIVQTNTPLALTGDCGCLMHIEGGLKFQKRGVAGKHLASFLWERTHAKS